MKRVLLCCWRITLALLLAAVALPVAAFLYLAPDAKSLQPGLEALVAEQTGLGTVRLGTLSWHWNGWLWLHSDNFSMATGDRSLQFSQAAIDIRLSPTDLLRGDITPDRLSFSGGIMRITPRFFETPLLALPPIPYRFDNLTVRWTTPELQHDFILKRLDANLNGGDFALEMAHFNVHGELRPDLLPKRATISWDNLLWLPEAWLKPWVSGDSRGTLNLRALGNLRWEISGDSNGNDGPITLHLGSGLYPTDHITGTLISVWKRQEQTLQLQSLRLKQATWRLGQQEIQSEGEWEAGLATLHTRAERLAMPQVWQWLRPLGGTRWRQWLESMHDGEAQSASATLTIPWPEPLHGAPKWTGMRYKVQAEIRDSDIALGLNGERLTATRGTLHLDERRLWAKVEETTLPHNLGTIHGTVTIPWQTLELAIHGSGQTDLQQILKWQQVKERVRWKQSTAQASFDMRWKLDTPEPHEAKVVLRPDSQWRLSFAGINARMEEGYLLWKPGSLTMHDMTFHIGQVGGACQATLRKEGAHWALTDFLARSRIDLTGRESIAAPFVQNPRGELRLQLTFDGRWHGGLDATDASWSNLLGSMKKAGEQLHIAIGEIRFSPDSYRKWSVHGIRSDHPKLIIRNASIRHGRQRLTVDIPRLRTDSIDGAFHFVLPDSLRKTAALEFTIRSLQRKTLRPLVNSWRHRKSRRTWVVNGTIDRFRWGDNLSARKIALTRNRDGSNRVTIANMTLEGNRIHNLSSRFSLAPDHVNVDELHATVDQQKLMVSASLRKIAEGRWQWSGIASLDGPFGGLMKQMKLSRLFADGTIHALFNGRGELIRHQPWWQSLKGRLRMRVDDGRILKSGTLTRLLAATSLFDLPKFLTGARKDLTGKGMLFRHLQLEGNMANGVIDIHRIALRSSAMDVAGTGKLDIGHDLADVYLVARPFQNLDTIINSIPLVRDILGGPAHSLFRKIYHLHGPLNDARIDPSTPKAAGLRSAGVIDTLLNLPTLWFGAQPPS